MTAKKSNKVKYALARGSDVDIARKVVRDTKGRRVTQDYVDRAVADVHAKVSRGRP